MTELEKIEEQLKKLQAKIEILKSQNTDMFEIWRTMKDYITRNDNTMLDWDNEEQSKYFVYAVTDTGQLKIGKTTKFTTPFVIYASSPVIIKKAVDFIGEDKIKRFCLEMPYKESEPLILYTKQKEEPKIIGRKLIYVYDLNKKFITTFQTNIDCAKFLGKSQPTVSRACRINEDGLVLNTGNYYIKYANGSIKERKVR